MRRARPASSTPSAQRESSSFSRNAWQSVYSDTGGNVMGMTREIFDRISPYLTVYSERSDVSPEYAPPFLLSALTGIHALPRQSFS